MSDIYLQITETPTVVTLSAPVVSGALASTVTVANTVTVALDSNSLSALENVTVTVGAAITGTVTVSNFPASQAVTFSAVSISNFPATQPVSIASVTVGNTVTIAGTVTANPTGTQTIAGTVTANVFGQSSLGGSVYPLPVNESGNSDNLGRHIPIGFRDNNGDSQIISEISPLPISGTVLAIGYQSRELPIEQDGLTAGYGNYIPIGYRDDGNARIVDSNQPLPISGTVTIGSAIPAGTARIGVVTVGAGTVTIGAGTAQIGSVTASISNFPATQAVSLTTLPALVAGTAQIGSVTASISGTVPISISSVTIGSLPALAAGTAQIGSVTASISANPSGALTTRFGSVTTANTAQITTAVTNTSRKYLFAQNISVGSVTVGIGFSPTTTQGIQLSAGSGIVFDSFCPTGAVYWLGATTGAAWSILEG